MTSSSDSLIAWLSESASDHPQRPALVDRSDALRYGELWQALGRWSRTFADAGLKRGAPTAILSRSRMRIARGVWLGLYAGFPVLPLDPSQLAAGQLLAHCGIRQIIADGDLALPSGLRRLPSARLDDMSDGPAIGPQPLAPGTAQLLMTSSGTSGPPRAAMLTGSNLMASAAATCVELDLKSDDAWLVCLPLTHVAGLMIVLRCCRAGAGVVIHETFDPDAIWRAVRAAQITRLSLVPSMLHQLLDVSGDQPPRRVRSVLVGGAQVSVSLARRATAAGWSLRSTYGMSESASHVAMSGTDPGNPGLRPLPGVGVDIVDDRGDPVSGSGWVRVSGPTVMAGYANPRLRPGDGLTSSSTMISKDIGRLDGNGRLRLIGRGDDVLISGGLNIHPSEVETLLAGCMGVRETAVTGRPDPVWGQRLVAVYVGDIPEDEFRVWADVNIASHLRPREFLRVTELPRGRLGKVDRHAVLTLLKDPAVPAAGSDNGKS